MYIFSFLTRIHTRDDTRGCRYVSIAQLPIPCGLFALSSCSHQHADSATAASADSATAASADSATAASADSQSDL